MTLSTLMAIAAFAAALVLVVNLSGALAAIVAAVVAGVQVAIALGWIHLSIAGVSLGWVTAIALTVTGVLLFLKVQAKYLVGCATLVTAVGALQLLGHLGIG